MLLTRDQFRETVFERDNHTCVVCPNKAVDAHHIVDRRLFENGGYYLDNGASLCNKHHLQAEMTVLSCEILREAIRAKEVILPEHFYTDTEYDKWGNIILPNRTRLKGELFEDASVQKILAAGKMLVLFVPYVKYPRTLHLPFSPGFTKNDRVMSNVKKFEGRRVIVTVKLDGENTTCYRDHIHARSVNSGSHPSRDWVKNFWSSISYNIPEGWRICGENLWAKHSIHYQNLSSWLQIFSIWNDKNICLSWDETKEWADLLGIDIVPILYDGIWDEDIIKTYGDLLEKGYDGDECEGYVVRIADAFPYGSFRKVVGKFVRKDHVRTHGHWMRSFVIKNKLRPS